MTDKFVKESFLSGFELGLTLVLDEIKRQKKELPPALFVNHLETLISTMLEKKDDYSKDIK